MSVEPSDFRSELRDLLNRHSLENGSDTPDWVLRNFLWDSLQAFDEAVRQRTEFYNGDNTK